MNASRTLARFALVVSLCTVPLAGQQDGTPSSTGFIPRIEAAHRLVGVQNRIDVTHFAANAVVGIIVRVAPPPMAIPGSSLASTTSGSVSSSARSTGIGPWFADGSGTLRVTTIIPPAVAHATVCLRAISLDAGAPTGVALSEERGLVFGHEAETVAIAMSTGGDGYRLQEAFPDGAPSAVTDARLADVKFQDVELTSSSEMARGHLDVPAVDQHHWTESILELPDGSAVVGVDAMNGEQGYVRVSPRGRIDILLWAAALPSLEDHVAVSRHDPYLAVVNETPTPEYAGAKLLLVRTDGNNVPWITDSAVGIPTGTYDIETSTLCFLDGALFFGNGSSLRRLDLDTLAVTTVAFPASAGAAPSYVDESCAPAENGSVLAIGAGATATSHDVYAVTADGVAVNVTQDPGIYHEARPADSDGMKMAVDPTGSRIAFVRTTYEPQVFVVEIATPGAAATLATDPVYFQAYIDTVVGVGFAASHVVAFVAGDTPTKTELYSATVAPGWPFLIRNLSASSTTTSPPWDYGELTLDRRFSSGDTDFNTLDFPDGSKLLFGVDAAGGGQGFDTGSIKAIVPVANAVAIVDETVVEGLRVRVVATNASPPVILSEWNDVGGELTSYGLAASGQMAALMVKTGGGNVLVRVNAQGQIGTAPGPVGDTSDGLELDTLGRVLVTVKNGNMTHLVRSDLFGPTWATLWSSSVKFSLLR